MNDKRVRSGQQPVWSSGERELDLNPEFLRAVELMENGLDPVFITGKAGTGKSTLLEYWRSRTHAQVAVLAPTGVAALNVGGVTIHSFFGFKPEVTVEKVRRGGKDKELAKVLAHIDAIVIDEISMVRADLMDCIDSSLRRHVGRKDLPFGGKRMIMIGDLYQLPPVVTRDHEEYMKTRYGSPYFFAADVFKECATPERIELEKVYRQRDDKFVDLLNAFRAGEANAEHLKALNKLYKPGHETEEDWITLTTTNQRAAQVNEMRIEALKTPGKQYPCSIEGTLTHRDFPTDNALTLKVGAQVMMVSNDPEKRWVNGTLGRIVEIVPFSGNEDLIRVRLTNGETVDVWPFTWELSEWRYDAEKSEPETAVVGKFRQYPMKLAWAVTIHKSQGKTFDKVVVDISGGVFAHGQLYVALSRCRTFEGMILRKPVMQRDVRVDSRVTAFLRGEAQPAPALRPRQQSILDGIRVVPEQDAWRE